MSSSVDTPKRTGRGRGVKKKVSKLVPVTAGDKLLALAGTFNFTHREMSHTCGCSVRAIEDRLRRARSAKVARESRPNALDDRIDDLYAIAALLHERYHVDPELVRAFVSGKSPYLEEQRPSDLIAAGYFEVVRHAALAFARGIRPDEHLIGSGPTPRVAVPR
ncbi:MAG: hypothetical protein JWR63_186 [Conexibacter sp.]|nr:hypothetical protein [Conexibacter sp.]